MSHSTVSIESIIKEYKDVIDKQIEKWVPKEFDEKSLKFFCGPPSYKFDIESASKALTVPIWDLLDRGGKRWRPVLMILISESQGEVTKVQKEAILDLLCLCELVHNGSLVVDDIEDNSLLRRGKPCLHHIYGTDIALNAGNALFFFPMLVLRELQKIFPAETCVKMYDVVIQECINLHFGQGLDIYWHQGKKPTPPAVEEYLQMCAFKTGTLARLSAKLGMITIGAESNKIEKFGKFAEAIGVAFQIQDDILNLVGEKFSTSVTGEDITEGKRSLMVIHCLGVADQKEKERLLEILNEHTREREKIDEAISILKKNGSMEYAKQKAKEIITSSWVEVESLIVSSESKTKLKAFADYLIEREI